MHVIWRALGMLVLCAGLGSTFSVAQEPAGTSANAGSESGPSAAAPVTPRESAVEITIFWEPGCPYCQKAKRFMEGLGTETRKSLIVRDFDISQSAQAQELFIRANAYFGISRPGVPLIIVGSQRFLGYDTDETSGQEILEAVTSCRSGSCPRLDELLAAVSEEQVARPSVPNASDLPNVLRLPLVGDVDIRTLSLPALTVVLAAIDGFNPCAMWVLVFLIGLLVGMQDRARMWMLGGAFLLASGFVYFLFLAAWLNLFLVMGAMVWVRFAVGAVALASGAYYLREFALNSAAECKVTNLDQRRRIMDAFRASVAEKRFLVAVAGIVVLAAAVNLIELFCSAGIPAVYTQILAMNVLPGWQHYSYLLLYVLVFMLDDAAIFVLAMMTLAAIGMTNRYLRFSHLVGGVSMLAIGVLLIFAPDWVNVTL